MTYKDWMTATTSRFLLEEADVELILVNQNQLIPDASADVDVKIAKTALCREIGTLLPLANISEGGYSISWNWEAIKLWYKSACAELGLTDKTKPAIRNKSNVW